MSLSREETETIIRFDEASNDCEIWTASRGVFGRLKRAGVDMKPYGGGWRGSIPKDSLIAQIGKRTCYLAESPSQNQFCDGILKRKKMAPRKPRAARVSKAEKTA